MRAPTRRAVLKGLLGGAAALGPLAIRPAWASGGPGARAVWFYLPNGILPEGWVPAEAGPLPASLPEVLAPLTPHRRALTVISGLRNLELEANNRHAALCGACLTGEDLLNRSVEGPDGGVGVDQLAAAALQGDSPIRSLVLNSEGMPACPPFTGWTARECLYQNHMSWASLDEPVPMETSIGAVRRRLFGQASSGRRAQQAQALSWVRQEADRLGPTLGAAHRRAVEGWVDLLAEAEGREALACAPPEDDPLGSGEATDVTDHAQQMLRMAALALHCGATRVVTYSTGREFTRRVLPIDEVPLSHHAASHHGGDPARKAMLRRVGRWQISLVRHLVDRLAALPMADGRSLLDHTPVIVVGAMGDGQEHSHLEVPALVIGGEALGVQGGRHLRFPDRPLADLHLGVLARLGVDKDRFGREGRRPIGLGG